MTQGRLGHTSVDSTPLRGFTTPLLLIALVALLAVAILLPSLVLAPAAIAMVILLGMAWRGTRIRRRGGVREGDTYRAREETIKRHYAIWRTLFFAILLPGLAISLLVPGFFWLANALFVGTAIVLEWGVAAIYGRRNTHGAHKKA